MECSGEAQTAKNGAPDDATVIDGCLILMIKDDRQIRAEVEAALQMVVVR
jgi:hypothetical protein